MFDLFSSFIGNSYENPGIATGRPKVVLSLLSNGNIVNGRLEKTDLVNIVCNVASLKPILKEYPLTKMIVGIYTSMIKDIIGKSPFEIKLTSNDEDHPTLQNSLNEYLKDIKFKEFILENLSDALYEGSYASYCYSDKDRWKSVPIKCATNLVQVIDSGDIKWYIVSDSSYSSDLYSAELGKDNPKIIDAKNILYVGFDKKPVKELSKKELKKYSSVNLPNTFENNYVVKLQYKVGRGVCDDILSLLFEHMLTYLMKLLLSIRNIVRPDVFLARIGDTEEEEDITQIGEALRNIESLLNNTSNQSDFRVADPSSMLAMIYTSMLNMIKVVPSIANYTELEKVDLPDLTDKLRQLEENLDKVRQSIANQMGIPDELMSGQSNRWEVVSRSSRFLTAINDKLNDISRSVKDKVIQYAKDTFNKSLTYADLDLVLDTSNIIFNQEANSRQIVMSELIGNIAKILSDVESINSTGAVDPDMVYDYVKKQFSNLDPEIPKFIIGRPQEPIEREEVTK